MPADDSERAFRPGRAKGARHSEPPLDTVDLPIVGSGSDPPPAEREEPEEELYDGPTTLWDRSSFRPAAAEPEPGAGGHLVGKAATDRARPPAPIEDEDTADRVHVTLEAGDVVDGVKLIELMASGERVSCWRAQKQDGTSVTVHGLYAKASERDRAAFREAAARQGAIARENPFRGIAHVHKIVPDKDAYIVEVAAAGTMDDLPMLSWSLPEKISFLRRVAAAVGVVHSSGSVHGCLRPAGVLLDDEELAPVLSDIATVKLRDVYGAASIRSNEYSPYAAPEVRRGGLPDARSDIYSLGRMLQFLLLGERPHGPDEEVPLLDELKDEPEGLVRIIRRCTVRNPAKRYRAVDELLDDIAKYQNADAVGLPAPEGPQLQAVVAERERTPLPRSAPQVAPRERTPPSERAAPAARPTNAVVARKPEAPTEVAGAEDDATQRRLQLVWLFGIVLLVAAVAISYFTATQSIAATAAAALGAGAVSFVVPPILSRALVSRALVAGFVVIVTMWFEPADAAALAGRRAKLTSGSPQERAQSLLEMKQRGVVEFSDLDFSGVDFSGKDLRSLVFDRTSFKGATLHDTRLADCSLQDADVSHADVSGADLRGIDVTNLVGWDKVRCDAETQLPTSWVCENGLPRPQAATLPKTAPTPAPSRRPPAPRRPAPQQPARPGQPPQ